MYRVAAAHLVAVLLPIKPEFCPRITAENRPNLGSTAFPWNAHPSFEGELS
jgi:hypothetical protein